MGRKKDEIWEYAEEKSANGRFECKFCKDTFGGGATRIKEHLAGGSTSIRVCAYVPLDVQKIARSKVEDIKKRRSKSTSMTGKEKKQFKVNLHSSKVSKSIIRNYLAKKKFLLYKLYYIMIL